MNFYKNLNTVIKLFYLCLYFYNLKNAVSLDSNAFPQLSRLMWQSIFLSYASYN